MVMVHGAAAASAVGHNHRTKGKISSAISQQALLSNARMKQQARSGSMMSQSHQHASAHLVSANTEKIVPSSERLHKEIIKSGRVELQKADSSWVVRIMTLSAENLSFSETTNDPTDSVGQRLMNYIPLEELTDVRVLEIRNLTQDSFKTTPSAASESGPSSPIAHLRKQDSFRKTPSNSSQRKPGSPMALAGTQSNSALKLSASCRGGKAVAHPVDGSFELATLDAGHNGGRAFTLKSEDLEAWVEAIRTHSKARFAEFHYRTRLRKLKVQARDLYNAGWFQCIVAMMVVLNFAMDAAQAEYEPEAIADSRLASPAYEIMDVVFLGVFLTELILNLFGNWFWDFFTDGWSLFDLFIIILSVLSLVLSHLASLSLLRVFRAVRVLRLLKRFESLRRIVQAIRRSIFPVLSALVLVVLVTAIFTIVGVYLFAEQSPADFGNFSLSICTLFAVMAFGSWPWETVPAVRYDEATDTHSVDASVWSFIITFTAVVSWTCLQVVVAVLLDNFMQVTASAESEEAKRKHVEKRKGHHHPIDGLLAALLDSAETEHELAVSLENIFAFIDEDETGTVCFEELSTGMKKLNLEPVVMLTEDDFEALTENGALCETPGEITCEIFCLMVMNALHSYTERSVSDSAALHSNDDSTVAILQGIRLLLMDSDKDGRAATRARQIETHATAVTRAEHDNLGPATQQRPTGNSVAPGPHLITPAGSLGVPRIIAERDTSAIDETCGPGGSGRAGERMARMETTIEEMKSTIGEMAAMMKRQYGSAVPCRDPGSSVESEAADHVPLPSRGSGRNLNMALEPRGRARSELDENREELVRTTWLPDEEGEQQAIDSTTKLERLIHGFRVARGAGWQPEDATGAAQLEVVLEKEEPQQHDAEPARVPPSQQLRHELAEAMRPSTLSLIIPSDAAAGDRTSSSPRPMELPANSLTSPSQGSRLQVPVEADGTLAGQVISVLTEKGEDLEVKGGEK